MVNKQDILAILAAAFLLAAVLMISGCEQRSRIDALRASMPWDAGAPKPPSIMPGQR